MPASILQRLSMINKTFIKKWLSHYKERIDNNTCKYEVLIKQTKLDVKCYQTLSIGTLINIIDWKSFQTWKKLKFERSSIKEIQKTIQKILIDKNLDKIYELKQIQGIGVSVASTLLHFIFPLKYPIIDSRVIKTLSHANLIDHKTNFSVDYYYEYRDLILGLKKKFNDYSIREIDNALFEFNKCS
jgi:hypothetical protein